MNDLLQGRKLQYRDQDQGTEALNALLLQRAATRRDQPGQLALNLLLKRGTPHCKVVSQAGHDNPFTLVRVSGLDKAFGQFCSRLQEG